MTALQFSEWIAYYSLEPFGEERADWRQAITSAIIFNANRGKNSKAAKPSDFILKEEEEPREPCTVRYTGEQTEEQQRNIFELVDKAAKARKGKYL